MAKFVLAGKADCPFYALAEYLGDQLTLNLPDFKFHKIIKTSKEWQNWLQEICEKNNWKHTKSPIIWRELVDRGGKGTLIGGVNEFQEYAHGYYGVTIDMSSEHAVTISKENEKTKEIIDREKEDSSAKYDPLYMCITNASNPICFALISYLLSGEIFKFQPDIALNLFDADPSKLELLELVAEDIMNMGYSTLKENVRVVSDVEKAFQKCQVVIFLDELLKDDLESKQDWLKKSSDIFSNYGRVLNEVAHRNVKVFVAGEGNINLYTSILIENAPNIQKKNFVGVSRFLEHHAKSVLAQALNVNTSCIADLAIWGKINQNYLVNIQKSRVYQLDCSIIGPQSYSLSAVDMVFKEKWLKSQYNTLVESRKKTVEKQLRHPEYNLHARAIALTLNDLWNGSTSNNFFSLAIMSQGWYGVPEGIVFSFPVQMSRTGDYNVVEDFDLTPEFEQRLLTIITELQIEKRLAAGEFILEYSKEEEEKEVEKTSVSEIVTETTLESVPEKMTEATSENLEKVLEESLNPEEEEEEEEEEETTEIDEETVGSTFETTVISTMDQTETATEDTSALETGDTSTDALTETKSNDPSVDADLNSDGATTEGQ